MSIARCQFPKAARDAILSLNEIVQRADPNSALSGLTLTAMAFSALLQTYALPNANCPEGMCDNPDAFRRHFAEIVARGPVKAKASAKKAGKPKGKKK